MKKIILVRYGQHENGHLAQEGRNIMEHAAEKLKVATMDTKVKLLSAPIPRATESAAIIASVLGVPVETAPQLYAAEEDGALPDCTKATGLLNALGEECEIIVAVVSREYIETLPSFILNKDLETHLDRGECLVIDLEGEGISYLGHRMF